MILSIAATFVTVRVNALGAIMEYKVKAFMSPSVFINCPVCEELIDILDPEDTSGVYHNEDNVVLNQVFRNQGFGCFSVDDVKCSKCETILEVEGLEL